MSFESDKIMFEIYQDTKFNQKFRVVYYTELTEHNKHYEINRATAGKNIYDGFIKELKKDEAKTVIENIVNRLNDGENINRESIRDALLPFTP